MGIRDLQTFVDKDLNLLRNFELHNCDVVLDGNSIYHQMYNRTDLVCVFGGEYDRFYRSCIQLFNSFHKCKINVLVVFDGAQLNDRKWSTILARAHERVDRSLSIEPKVDLNPLLLRQTFINVLDLMKIPYVSALGEGDDECVSLANHLNCYLIAQDSNYYCYNLRRGYVPFCYMDIHSIAEDVGLHLNARLYNIDSLLNQFNGLQPSTLALACCLSGNDYISRGLTRLMLERIVVAVQMIQQPQRNENNQTRYLRAAIQWIREFNNVDLAFERLLQMMEMEPTQIEVGNKLRTALQSYLTPSDTLIYRFISPNNYNLLTSSHFVERARTRLNKLGMNDDQIKARLVYDCQCIKSKRDHPLPLFLADAVIDLRLSSSFIEILIHRRLISKAHIEIQHKPSIYKHAIPILLPCLAILLQWDQEQSNSSVTIYHRENVDLKPVDYPVNNNNNDNVLELEQIQNMSLDDRQNFVRNCVEAPKQLLQQWNNIHSDYHFWLMIIRYWYLKQQRRVSKVYLYAVIVCLIKSVFLRNDVEFELIRRQLNSLVSAFGNDHNDNSIDPTSCKKILKKLNQTHKTIVQKNSPDTSIIYELNCLQTIYMFSLKTNEFFGKPFVTSIHPHYFISGSLFHAFVYHYQNKNNLDAAMDALFLENIVLVNFMRNIYTCITSDV